MDVINSIYHVNGDHTVLKKIYIFFIVSFIFLPGCLKVKQYAKKTLIPLNPHIHYKTNVQDITLRTKQFNQIDCFRLFGERGKKLITRNRKTSIYPIQLSITNKSDKTYILNKKNIGIRIMKYHHVAHRMQHSTALRSMGLLFSSVALATLTAIGGITAILIGMATTIVPVAVIGAAACASAPFMLVIGTPISTTVNSVKSLRTNTVIKKDVKDKSLAYQIVIQPQQSIDTIIFIRGRELKENFGITLYDQDDIQDKVTLNVQLHSIQK